MSYRRLSAALLSGVLLLFLAACGDASDVGLGVGEGSLEGGDPTTVTLTPELDTTRIAPVTGINSGTAEWRFLAGTVDDDIAGTIAAEGYVDFLPPSSIPETIRNASPSDLQVKLTLTPEYIHGDTSSSVDLSMATLDQEASLDSAQANESFGPATAIDKTFSISPADSVVTLTLPSSWLTPSRRLVLQDTSESFREQFHGFRISGAATQAVVGFTHANATLRLEHREEDASATYNTVKSFTHVERRTSPSVPPNRRLIQGGLGTGLTMTLDSSDFPRDAPLNQADFRIQADTAAITDGLPATFVRNAANGFRLEGALISADALEAPPGQVCASLIEFNTPQGIQDCPIPLVSQLAPGTAQVDQKRAFNIFRRTLSDGSPFSTYRLEVAARANTDISLSETLRPGLPSTLPVLIPTEEDGALQPPQVSLTVTPLSE